MFNRSRSVYSSRRQAQKSALKPAHSRGGGSSRYGGQRRRAPSFAGRGGRGENINTSRFINKTAVNCAVEQFVPTHKFADFHIDETLKKAIIAKGYITPTPIQDVAIPHILKGADLMGIANTGTGKTGAFLIPLINKVRLDRKQQVLIIAPTRELAIQIDSELKDFTAGMKIYSVCVVGGMSIGRQISELRYQYNFIIGTPGRLKDLINRKMIHLSEFNTVVLDEADRMLDMGFIDEMRFVMAGMPKERQTLFFTATLSPAIERLIGEFLRNPIRVSVKKGDTAKNVDQDVVRIQKGESKFSVLHNLLTKKEFCKVLVFGRTKSGVEKLSGMLVGKGIKAESIHGNKNHVQRQRALGKFKENRTQVLVATDVAARGLDIADISHVINYDIPQTYDDYVHRIGRTGRGDKQGKALTFIE